MSQTNQNRWIMSELKGLQEQWIVVAAKDGQVVTAYLDPGDKTQQWLMLGTLHGSGIQGLFYSVTAGLYLAGPADHEPATLSDKVDDNSIWTADHVGTDYTLRPYRNSSMNLNIKNANRAAGAVVQIWGWGGGMTNEVWDVHPAGVVKEMAAASAS